MCFQEELPLVQLFVFGIFIISLSLLAFKLRLFLPGISMDCDFLERLHVQLAKCGRELVRRII